MNPLLSFWMKVQPLTGGMGVNAWKAVGQSSALAPQSGDDAAVSRPSTTCQWALGHLHSCASRLASHAYWDLFYWASSTSSLPWRLDPTVHRVRGAPTAAPSRPIGSSSSIAACEGYRPRPARAKVEAEVPGIFDTSLQRSQRILQQRDFDEHRIGADIVRRNSREWVPQYKKERIDKINYNNVFGGASDLGNNEIPALPPPSEGPSSSPVRPDSPLSSAPVVVSSATIVSAEPSPFRPLTKADPGSGACVDGPSMNDVICGRGGKANTHPGNRSFREEAGRLRAWYEASSKSEKFAISSLLVEEVLKRGGRFIKRNAGGWAEADGDDARKKASQALREGRRTRGS